MKPLYRLPLPFLFLAILALLAALWAGLMRLGWRLPPLTPSLVMAHGPLMISGFLGTLITLERAVALRQKWMYLPPLLSGLGWLITLLIPSPPLGPILLTLASLGGVAILIEITRREFALHTVTMLLGAVMWFAGNLLWLFGWQVFQVVFFWQAFLVLTIADDTIGTESRIAPFIETAKGIRSNRGSFSRQHRRIHFRPADRNAAQRRSIAPDCALVHPQ
jgi:hypothetical protein